MPGKRYRHNVCTVVQRPGDGKVLCCHRVGYPPDKGWQLPQGGIRRGYDLIEEMRRELREEIGTDQVEVVSVSEREYFYNFPDTKNKRYRGQRQRWVLVMVQGENPDIHFSHMPQEFDTYQWLTPTEVLQRIVEFKRSVYEQALHDLGLIE